VPSDTADRFDPHRTAVVVVDMVNPNALLLAERWGVGRPMELPDPPTSWTDISLIKSGSGASTRLVWTAHLRNMKINMVIYTGVITNGCFFRTAAAGFDRGYRGLVGADAAATLSARLQTTTELLIDGFIANVVQTEDIVRMFDNGDVLPVVPRNPARHGRGRSDAGEGQRSYRRWRARPARSVT
jgi:hypothetical protein